MRLRESGMFAAYVKNKGILCIASKVTHTLTSNALRELFDLLKENTVILFGTSHV
jgi:hypothetical protein